MKITDLSRWTATVLGLGYIPWAPGTWGSGVGLLLAWLTRDLPFGAKGIVLAVLILAGGFSAHRLSLHLGERDPACVIIDEVAGAYLTFLGHPFTWPRILTGFFLFRALDILKPPPLRWLENIPWGIGIMADDLLAGALASLLLGLFF